jgi:hypothetical protein
MKTAASLMLGVHNELRDVVQDKTNAYINSIWAVISILTSRLCFVLGTMFCNVECGIPYIWSAFVECYYWKHELVIGPPLMFCFGHNFCNMEYGIPYIWSSIWMLLLETWIMSTPSIVLCVSCYQINYVYSILLWNEWAYHVCVAEFLFIAGLVVCVSYLFRRSIPGLIHNTTNTSPDPNLWKVTKANKHIHLHYKIEWADLFLS